MKINFEAVRRVTECRVTERSASLREQVKPVEDIVEDCSWVKLCLAWLECQQYNFDLSLSYEFYVQPPWRG